MKLIKGLFDMMDFILPNAYKYLLIYYFVINNSRFKYPCLVIHGNCDIINNYEDSVKFYNKISRYVLFFLSTNHI